jgi:excisionase family DNA binding protein
MNNMSKNEINKGEDRVFNVEQACKYLQTTRITLYKLINEGKIPAAKVGRSWRILKSEIDKYLRGE